VTDLAVARLVGHHLGLAVCGVPSLLVPYPRARRHREANGREVERVGGAEVVPRRS
jgi:UDP-N-acetylglucosamine:LPS N-acetylglucosamine transferase